MTARIVIGIIFLILAGLFAGTMVMMTGFDMGAGNSSGRMLWIVYAVPVGLILALVIIGVLIMGIHLWNAGIGWFLVGSALYALLISLMLNSFINSPEWPKMLEASRPGSAEDMADMSFVFTQPAIISLVMLAVGALLIAWRFRDRRLAAGSENPEHIGATAIPANGRPVSVTVLSWVIIITSSLSVLYLLFMSFGDQKEEMAAALEAWDMSFGFQMAWGLIGSVAGLVCGLLWLKGNNAARWVYLGLMLIGLGVSYSMMGSLGMLLPAVLWLAAIVYLLFLRKPAADFFRAKT